MKEVIENLHGEKDSCRGFSRRFYYLACELEFGLTISIYYSMMDYRMMEISLGMSYLTISF